VSNDWRRTILDEVTGYDVFVRYQYLGYFIAIPCGSNLTKVIAAGAALKDVATRLTQGSGTQTLFELMDQIEVLQNFGTTEVSIRYRAIDASEASRAGAFTAFEKYVATRPVPERLKAKKAKRP